jgi:ArsR family transcriptional regulator
MVVAQRQQQWMVYQLPPKRTKELDLQLQCLQDCVQTHSVFRDDLKRLKKMGCGCEPLTGRVKVNRIAKV